MNPMHRIVVLSGRIEWVSSSLPEVTRWTAASGRLPAGHLI